MLKKSTWVLFVFFPIISFSQSKRSDYFSATLAGGFTGASVQSGGGKSLPPNASETMRFNYGIHAWYTKEIGSNWDMQVGVGYLDIGFRRQQADAKLGERTYPGIGDGMILDATNARKDINYDYRFHNLQIPLMFNFHLYKSKDFRSDYMICGGATANVLLKHHMTARLENFTVDEKKTFQLDSTGLDGRVVNANLNLGFLFLHKVDKNVTIVIQPTFSYYPLSITSSDIKVNPYMFTIHAGVLLDFVKGVD